GEGVDEGEDVLDLGILRREALEDGSGGGSERIEIDVLDELHAHHLGLFLRGGDGLGPCGAVVEGGLQRGLREQLLVSGASRSQAALLITMRSGMIVCRVWEKTFATSPCALSVRTVSLLSAPSIRPVCRAVYVSPKAMTTGAPPRASMRSVWERMSCTRIFIPARSSGCRIAVSFV